LSDDPRCTFADPSEHLEHNTPFQEQDPSSRTSKHNILDIFPSLKKKEKALEECGVACLYNAVCWNDVYSNRQTERWQLWREEKKEKRNTFV